MKIFKYLILIAVVMPDIAHSMPLDKKIAINKFVNMISSMALGASAAICIMNENDKPAELFCLTSVATVLATYFYDLSLLIDLEEEGYQSGYQDGFRADPNHEA